MKKVFLYILSSLFILVSCQKEDPITDLMEFDNLFEIIDDAGDPVQHRVYQIYKEYGVPVFFNDTVGQKFLMNDVAGQPIFHYEKIDLGWTFHSYLKQNFEFEYMTEEAEKMQALDIIEAFLSDSSPALHPFSFFVTRSGKKLDKGAIVEEYKEGSFMVGFRTVYMTGNWTEEQIEETPELMKRQLILDKILNYPDDITDFSIVSQANWYGGLHWEEIDPNIPRGWPDIQALYEDWVGAKWYTEEELEQMRHNARIAIGKFGFIKGNAFTKGLQTPQRATDELKDYIEEILKRGPEGFVELWGDFPLVMKKYNILMNVIENKMNVKL